MIYKQFIDHNFCQLRYNYFYHPLHLIKQNSKNMIQPDLLVMALSALIPLVIGAMWYNPKVFGTAWMNASGITPEMGKGANMPLVFGLTYLVCFFTCIALTYYDYSSASFIFYCCR